MGAELVNWLRAQDAEALGELLRTRPDVLQPEPRSLRDLAHRLNMPGPVYDAVAQLDRGALDLLATLRAFDDVRTRDGLADLFGLAGENGTADEQRVGELDRALTSLSRHGLAWSADDGQIALVAPLRGGYGELNLGRPVVGLLEALRAGTLNTIAERLGLEKGQRKPKTAERITTVLRDPTAVRAMLDTAPARTREIAEAVAWRGPRAGVRQPWESSTAMIVLEPKQQPHVAWLTERGFLAAAEGEMGSRPSLAGAPVLEMPREVALALRGPEYRIPLSPRPEQPTHTRVDVDEVDRAASAAWTELVDGVTRLLEECETSPVHPRKTGGIGVRELRRLAKSLASGEIESRLWLEIAYGAGLLDGADGGLVPSAAAARWRAAEPAHRLVQLLTSWWSLLVSPEIAGSADKPDPALTMPDELVDTCLRQDLLTELSRLPYGAVPAHRHEVDALVAWRRPAIHADSRTIAGPARLTWLECERLGIVALGALTTVGHHLVHSDQTGLLDTASRWMPRAQSTVVLQADLTATVHGMPSMTVSDTLNRMATAETRDTASIWRFDNASVRRALDEGYTADDLLEQLADVSEGPLPQPLRYLISDVSRRFGELAVAPMSCCVIGDDPNLLLEVSKHRQLRELRLRQLAPTVLASRTSPERTLELLRTVGYSPVPQDANGTVRLRGPESTRTPAKSDGLHPFEPGASVAPPHPLTRDLTELAAELLETADRDEDESDGTQRDLRGMATRLTPGELQVLSHAVDSANPIRIQYVDKSGSASSRTVTPLEFAPPWLTSFCHLRHAERDFRLDRIRSVSPVR